MPKMKTARGAAKRLKKTGGSKVKRGSAYRRHLLSNKTRKQKRRLRKDAHVDATNMPSLRMLLPN